MYPYLNFGPSIQISTYSLILSLDFCLCFILGLRWTQKNNLNSRTALDLGLLLLISGFIGARAFHVIYESPMLYIHNPQQIFYIWQGGFVYYGGLIASFITAYLYLKAKFQNPLQWLDVLTPIFSFGYAVGRLACFMAGCCYGKVCDLPWALNMANDQGLYLPRHPTQLYLSMWELLLLTILIAQAHFFKKNYKTQPLHGHLFFTWLPLHSAGRFFVEFYRDDFRGVIWGLSISGWISVVLILISLVFWTHKNSSKP